MSAHDRRTVRQRLLITGLLVVAVACGGAPPRPPEDGMPATPWTLTYADGAANQYRFARASDAAAVSFEYDPVTPEESSTGSYSGGEPVDRKLPAADPRLAELWRRVQALAADPGVQQPDRNKGTGAFHWKNASGERDFIVEQGSALTDFHTFVQTFRR